MNGCIHMLQHRKYYKDKLQNNSKCIKCLHCSKDCCIGNNSGKCILCNKIESTHHFIMECNMFNKLRFIIYCKCMVILNQYYEDFNLKIFYSHQ